MTDLVDAVPGPAASPLRQIASATSAAGVVVGVVALSTLIWMGGAFLALGTVRPLESAAARAGLIALLVVGTAAVLGVKEWRRRKAAAALNRELLAEPEDDRPVLAERMKEALATLRRSAKGSATYLYDLPWYVMIGPPATGKTTALVNSGLDFPLARGVTPEAVEGIGGTRNCDWLFAEEAVLIDTAGRYTTQDSDAALDRRSWLGFLDLLKRNRPKQPINGVIIAFALPDLLTLDKAELSRHAVAIRARLGELHDRLRIDFPVYALFTKADLIAGFTDYFADLGEDARRQVWGATFQTADRKANLIGDVPGEFDALIERLNAGLADRLQDEPVPGARVSLFGFPGQMSGLRKPVFDFLKQIFEPTRYQTKAVLRGFYFTSGTQHGTAVDRLLLALVKNFGAQEVGAAAFSGMGKSFFLRDLLTKVVIGEAAWVTTDRRAVRRTLLLRAAVLAAVAVGSAAAAGAWLTSYGRNTVLVADTDAATRAHADAFAALSHQDHVSDDRFDLILPALDALRAMPPARPAPPWSGFGLGQHADLAASETQSYGVALERMLRPRLLFRLESLLDAAGDPIATYQTLKVYMMLGGQHHPVDRALVRSWFANDLAALIPGAGTQEEARRRLVAHLDAMLDAEPVQPPLVQPSALIQSDAQKALTRLSAAQRAYALIRAQGAADALPDWLAASHAGQDFDRVFTAAPGSPGVRVPGFFTYAGFYRALLARLPGIAGQLKADDGWVLGEFGKDAAVAASYDTIDRDVLALYRQDFDRAWREALGRLQLRSLVADKPTYAVLGALAAKTTSPLPALLGALRDELALTRPRPGFEAVKPAGDAGGGDAPAAVAAQPRAPGADIEADFAALIALADAGAGGGGRPVDDLVATLGALGANLPGTRDAGGAGSDALLKQVAALRGQAARLPPPFRDMMAKAAGDFDGDVSTAIRQHLAQDLGTQVVQPCRTLLSGAYPFVTGGRDMAIDDFARLFAPAPTGAFDTFFEQSLKASVDTKRVPWAVRPDAPGARALSAAVLASFQHAAAIRDLFFPPRASAPSMTFRVVPSALSTPGYTARLEINGTVIETKAGAPNSGGSVTWPGPTQDGGVAAINLLSDTAGVAPVGIDPKYGGWALFRFLDGARPIPGGLQRSFALGTAEMDYGFLNPKASDLFRLLRSFSCPAGL